ncbi:hypothetical protein L3Q82_012089, partial [Scortum barcoo]
MRSYFNIYGMAENQHVQAPVLACCMAHNASDPRACPCRWRAHSVASLKLFRTVPSHMDQSTATRCSPANFSPGLAPGGYTRWAAALLVGSELLPQEEEFKYHEVLCKSEGKVECGINRQIGATSAVMR